MLEYVSSIRPYLEAIYFLASIGLFASVFVGFWQLRLIKRDIQIRNIRAAREKALEACDCYFTRFVPLSGQLFEARKKLNLDSYPGPVGDFSPQSIPGELMEASIKNFGLTEWLPPMNQLESMSAYFVSGVADESTGFQIIMANCPLHHGATRCSA